MFQFLYNFGLNSAALLRAPIGRSRKMQVFGVYLGLTLKYFTTAKLQGKGMVRQKFLGFVMEGFSFHTIYFLFSEIFVKNEYYFASHTVRSVIFDCGANIGGAVLYFKWLYPDSQIYAFEADPHTVAVLQRNIELNKLADVSVHQVALAPEDGEIDFFVDPGHEGSLKMSTIQRGGDGERVRVPARKLSSYAAQVSGVDFLKMDIEGAEPGVMAEAEASGMLSKVQAATFEYHHHIGGKGPEMSGFLAILERAGLDYIISARHSPGFKKGLFQDVLLVTRRT